MDANQKFTFRICLIVLTAFLPVMIIIGVLLDFILLSILYMIVILTIIGIKGGKWLWKEMISSDLFKSGVPVYIKMIGGFALAVFAIFIVEGFLMFFKGDDLMIHDIVQQGTTLMIFATFYNLGYLISIWKPKDLEEDKQNKDFTIKKRLSFFCMLIIIIYELSCLVIFFIITEELLSRIFIWFSLGGIGMVLGWIFWEHLKETRILTGSFLKDLKILSVMFEIPLTILMILGIISEIIWNSMLEITILLGYLLIIYLMFSYFLGLSLEIIKK